MADEPQAAEPDDEETSSRSQDTELKAIGQILRLIRVFDDEARIRIVDYLKSRVKPPQVPL